MHSPLAMCFSLLYASLCVPLMYASACMRLFVCLFCMPPRVLFRRFACVQITPQALSAFQTQLAKSVVRVLKIT